jgi:hypothetical protein
MRTFATIKKLPRQRTLTEEIGVYSNPLSIARTTTIFRSITRSLELTFTTSLTIHHLLSVEPGKSLRRLFPGSVFARENMPLRKKAFPVYTGGMR